MFKKLNSKILILVLVILGLAIALFFLLDNKKGDRTIKEELVRIDTAVLTSVSLFPQSEERSEIKLIRKGKIWVVKMNNITSAADPRSIMNLLNEFAFVKPQRLAATEKEQWKEYGVTDSLGTRIKFFSGENVLADLIIGRFAFNNETQSGLSYIRIYDEEETYAMEGYFSMESNQPFNKWRNREVLRGVKTNFTRISFNYPSDSGFVLSKENNKWMIGSSVPDSLLTDEYLTTLTMINSLGFVDDYTPTQTPLIVLTIEGNNMEPVTIKAFPSDSIHRFVLLSSYNPESYFSAREYGLDEKLFRGKKYFMPSKKTKKKASGKN